MAIDNQGHATVAFGFMHFQFTLNSAGTSLKLYTALPVVITNIATRRMPAIFIFHPVRTKPRKGTFPVPCLYSKRNMLE